MNETEDHFQYQDEQFDDEIEKINALNLDWTLGINYQIVNGVHNLSTDNNKELFYAVGHTGVLYTWEEGNRAQRLLQGHCNKITCTAVCPQEDILITADAGDDPMLVIWDAKTATPRKTIFDPHHYGVECLDVTPDGRFIVSVSKEIDGRKQEITIFEWKNPEKSKLLSHPVPITVSEQHKAKEYIKHVIFNPEHPEEFATTAKKRLLFWTWEKGAQGYEFYGPSYVDRKADFTQTVFIPGGTQAVTGTTDGHIVVWDISLIMEDYSQPEERRKIKIVNLMNTNNKTETAAKKPVPEVNILKIQDNFLVVGASNGSIRFYNFQYTIVSWFEDTGIHSITSISFSRENRFGYDDIKKLEDEEGQTHFDCPDFIVVDRECTVHLCKSAQFEEIEDEKKKPEVLMQQLKSPIVAMAVRPLSYTLAIVCENGELYKWSYYDRDVKLRPFRQQYDPKCLPTCIEYSPDGNFLAIATSSGTLIFWDYTKGEMQSGSQGLMVSISQDNPKDPRIHIMTFSGDSQYLAVADDFYSISLFKYDYKDEDQDKGKEWSFSGKVRTHLNTIRSIAFGESQTESGEIKLRLFSIGDDKMLVEYDIYNRQKFHLQVANSFQIEQECNPTTCIWYPVDAFKENILLTANEDYKIKLWNANNVEKKITKKTCLGPSYKDPINKFIKVKGQDSSDFYLAYSTKEKIVGLIKLPIDGNPNNCMGLIAHPEKITGMGISSDGKSMFTSGSNDFCVNKWTIDLSVMDQNAVIQAQQDVFPDLLEGGRQGQMYRDLKDFFYYSQIRSKQENTTKARKLEGTVPLDEIPYLMRALGYYPTNKEIENMKNEVKFSEFLKDGTTVEECNLKTFVSLFVNHRPVYGIGKKNIEDALNILTEKEAEKGEIPSDHFLNLLQTKGEKMTEDEIRRCLSILIPQKDILEYDTINSDVLCKDILGFEELNDDIAGGEGSETYEQQQ